MRRVTLQNHLRNRISPLSRKENLYAEGGNIGHILPIERLDTVPGGAAQLLLHQLCQQGEFSQAVSCPEGCSDGIPADIEAAAAALE